MTPKQGQYLAVIHSYTVLHRQAPAEADLARYFRASPPSVHQMVLTLEKHGLVARLFAHNDAHPLDDAEFAPLIRCVAEAAEEELREAGVPLSESASASARVMDFAVERYVRLCARIAQKTDDAKDAETFRSLMAHGEWPRPGRGRR